MSTIEAKDSRDWDRQIEKEAKAGKLDGLADRMKKMKDLTEARKPPITNAVNSVDLL
jgi:hypothetical protein